MGIINAIVKKPKMDAKRLKAEIYFNSISLKHANKKTSSDMPKKHARDVFWTFNRLKILFSALVIFASLCLLSLEFSESAPAFFLFMGYMYLAVPVIGLFSNKLLKRKIKKTKFIKIGCKVYRRSEAPKGIILISIVSMILFGIILTLFNASSSAIGGVGFHTLLSTPFIMYHLLCFIGDHPLTIWKAIEFDNRNGHNSHNFSHNQSYDWNVSTDESRPGFHVGSINNPSGIFTPTHGGLN